MIPTVIEKFTRQGEHVVDVACGYMHGVASSDQSRLYSWGEGFKGKLGQGYDERLKMCENQPRPTEIRKKILGKKGEVEVKIKQVCCGASISLLLRLNGQLLVTGKNEFMGVTSDDYLLHSIPQQIKVDVAINQIACGYDHYLFTDEQGQLWGCGENVNGCLGVPDGRHRILPQKNEFFWDKRIVDFSCGKAFSVIIIESFEMTDKERSSHFMDLQEMIANV